MSSGKRRPAPEEVDMPTLPTTLLKKLSSICSKDERQLLTSFLLTIYGNNMVVQGHMALACDRLEGISKCRSMTEAQTAIEYLFVNLSDAMEETQNLSGLLGEAESNWQDALRSSMN